MKHGRLESRHNHHLYTAPPNLLVRFIMQKRLFIWSRQRLGVNWKHYVAVQPMRSRRVFEGVFGVRL